MKKDIVIIGGGAAGLAAAVAINNLDVLVIEREKTLGGILNQCIHNGFGLHVFKEELTGPEYASRFEKLVLEKNMELLLDTTVTKIKKEDNFFVYASNETGLIEIEAKAVILASGCYERTRGAITIPGDRPKGIMTAGSAQRYLNIEGYLVGKKVFILGSGDIGLIMARRMTLEGAKVLGVAEIMPYSNGLTRNIVQCLEDYNIPLYLSHTVTFIEGKDSLEKITIEQVDECFKPVPGTGKSFEVDTLLLSVGLIPDIALLDDLNVNRSEITKSIVVNQNYESNVPGLFACGNALHVHDLVDYVTVESEKAGKCAEYYVKSLYKKDSRDEYNIIAGDNIRYTVPQKIDFNNLNAPVEILFRTTDKFDKGEIQIIKGNEIIKKKAARYLAPAEMEKMIIDPKDLKSKGDMILRLGVDNK